MENEQPNKIEELKKALYSRTSQSEESRKVRFHPQTYDVKDDWQHNERPSEKVVLNEHYEGRSSTFFHKMLIGSLLFFLVALGVGAYILWRGSNIVSADNVDITVAGPVSVAGGETVSLDVKVVNKNKVRLTLVDLSVEYPSGTVDPLDGAKELLRFRESMPDIDPGKSGSKTLKAILYGEENSKKEINIKVEYRVPGSNAVFYKEKTYDVFINSSPVSLNVTSFNEVNSGQQFEIRAVVASNSKDPLKNILLKADYPFGFTFIKADPKPLTDGRTWNLGSLQSGEKRTIKITGKLDGQANEERVFKFAVGTQSSRNASIIGTQFVTSANSVNLKKPFLATDVSLNGGVGDMIGHGGESVNADVTWGNNLPNNIINAQIKVTLSGSALDKTSVSADQGFYRSSDNTIIWDQTTAKELADVAAGQSGHFSFRLTPRVGQGQTNPVINIDLSIKGTRVSEQNVPEEINSTVHRTIRVATAIDLAGQVLRTTGPFKNTGPIPPKPDTPTTYTIIWTVSNTSSSISNAEVRSSLPSYVKWLGVVTPSTESITYDQPSGNIVWKIGNLPAYTGITGARKEVAFQVEFTPSISQLGQSPILVNESTLVGTDQFSGANLNASKQALTTRFSTDPTYKAGDEVVKN